MREQFLTEKPIDLQDVDRIEMNKSMQIIQVKDRDRIYNRHFSEKHFFLQKSNGTREKREWLSYSETTGSIYCYICKLFSSKKTQLTSGYSDWKNVSATLSAHENSKDHRCSMIIYSKRLVQEGRIDTEMAKQLETQQQYWREVLKRVVATVQFLSVQGLAFRGHRESKDSTNKGNYLSCLDYLAEFDPFLANHVKKFANCGQGSVSYLSNTICDEFIAIMGSNLRDQFIQEVKVATYFALIVDSTPDVSHVDQLTFVLRYVLPDGHIKERFFSFIEIHAHDAAYLYQVIIDILKKWDIDITKCRGQSYDNASNMSGAYTGLQARIKSKSPTAEYIPCSNHSLNLVGNAAAESCTSAVTFFDFVQNLYVWFSVSTHRWAILE